MPDGITISEYEQRARILSSVFRRLLRSLSRNASILLLQAGSRSVACCANRVSDVILVAVTTTTDSKIPSGM
ncbi:MAG: hypothetical protein J7619_03075 [Dyadobacter sp.]|uniref:hypothetical protein n=1 Tax=Dyadobacter sp. TaxID=1914288 RepID=UPI001B2B605D|nr:hypothetical protein [Dyadobacter sp.]MBO9611648.1 hypothetical protein [Dyadobacter sp.]